MTAHSCTTCGKQVEDDANFCAKCGTKVEIPVEPEKEPDASTEILPKSPKIVLLLCLFLGIFGAHRFYFGRIRTGVAMLISLGGLGIWTLIDLVLITNNKFKDKQKNILEFSKDFSKEKKLITTSGIIIIYFIILAIILKCYIIHRKHVYMKNHTLAVKLYPFTAKNNFSVFPIEDYLKKINEFPLLKNYINQPIINDTQPTVNKIENNEKYVPYNAPIDDPLKQSYENKKDHYSIKYPVDWELQAMENGSIILRGKKTIPANNSTIDIQQFSSKKAGRKFNNIDQLAATIKNQVMEKNSHTKIIGHGHVELLQNNKKISGEVIIFTYANQGQEYKKMQFIFSNTDGSALYAWAYTSPASQYNIDLMTAENIYHSWSISQ